MRPTTEPHEGRTGQSGFTLVELAMGISLTVLLLAGALTGLASHQAQRRVHGERILAMTACRNTMEMLRSVDYVDLPTFQGRGFDVPGQNGGPSGLTPVRGDADGLAGEIAVVVDRTSGPTILYRVTTRVRWQGVTRNGDFSMQCLMGERR